MAISPPIEPQARPAPARRVRAERVQAPWTWPIPLRWEGAAFGLMALVFVGIGAGGLDLDPGEARLGLAAGSSVGPLGQVFGYWAPDVWPAELAPSVFLAWFEPLGRPTPASIRWPSALAGVLIGMILWRGASSRLGRGAGFAVALCWLASIGLVDRSGATGLDLIQALFVMAGIERIHTRGKDLTTGIWAAMAFLAGGWPPLVMIGLAAIVIGRAQGRFSIRPYAPVAAVVALWSVWAIGSADSEAWAAALTLPLTRRPDWFLGLSVLVLGLPWSPLAFFAGLEGVRSIPSPAGRAWAKTWVQVGAAAVVAGTFVPGLGAPARALALAGVAVAAALVLDAVWERRLAAKAQTAFLAVFSALAVVWLTGAFFGGYVWIMTMPYYRAFGVVMVLFSVAIAILVWSSLAWGNTRRAVLALTLAAIGIKLVHVCYYAPEWNYRRGQGPWARAVAQWVPRRSTVYTFHDWPADFAFYLKRPVRQLRSPEYVRLQPKGECKFVLLVESEFANWPESATPIIPLARFHDADGGERVLARTTDGPAPLLGPNASPQTAVELSLNDSDFDDR